MAIVADYLAIRDTEFTLRTGQDIDWQTNFNLGNAARLDQSMILQFFYVSHQNAANLSFRFSINGNAIRTINVTGNFFGSIHEIFNGSNLVHGQNAIEARIVGGTGGVDLSDVVLWFQHET
ncbi:MAG: hypothetical protein DYG89_12705 [Caldilinea sp. CFX5]|nr:hypothetical protein [Caldilinea sp. CFX5]